MQTVDKSTMHLDEVFNDQDLFYTGLSFAPEVLITFTWRGKWKVAFLKNKQAGIRKESANGYICEQDNALVA
jgi:hypothetical protein